MTGLEPTRSPAQTAADNDSPRTNVDPGGPNEPRRRRGRARLLLPLLTTLGLIAAWQLLSVVGVIPQEIASPARIVGWLAEHVQTVGFWTSLRLTLWHWAAGLAIAVVAGVVVGLALGTVPVVRLLLNTTLELLRPIPAVIYLPVVLLLWGGTSTTAIMLVAVGAFWPMLFQTAYGAGAVDPMLQDTGKLFGLRPRQRLMQVTLPSILPYVATGLRISSSLALIVAVAIELIGGVPGLGADLAKFAANGVYDGLYGLIAVTGVLGFIINLGMERAEHRVLHWHVAHRGGST